MRVSKVSGSRLVPRITTVLISCYYLHLGVLLVCNIIHVVCQVVFIEMLLSSVVIWHDDSPHLVKHGL